MNPSLSDSASRFWGMTEADAISVTPELTPTTKSVVAADPDKVTRLSISIPNELASELDRMVNKRGYKNRSQALADMVRSQLAEFKSKVGTESMAGTLSLVYDYRKRNLQQALSAIQHKYYLIIVASMHVHLEHHHYLEVLLVQGPANQLHKLADEFVTVKGVKTAKLQLTAHALPPLL